MHDCCKKEKWHKKFLSTALGTHHHHGKHSSVSKKLQKIALIGSPNVGKSSIFNKLTGSYATVSNYPGTTVEVFRGKSKINDIEYEMVDTPGMYSLLCITEEEKVTRDLILTEQPHVVLHIIDAKNIVRMLPLTLQLIESGLPVILVLNIMDEAKKLGLDIDIVKLQNELGIPVIATSAALNQGLDALRERIYAYGFAA